MSKHNVSGGIYQSRQTVYKIVIQNGMFSSVEIIFVGFSKNQRNNNNFRHPESIDKKTVISINPSQPAEVIFTTLHLTPLLEQFEEVY
jgi:hypothetical protein